MSKRGAAQAARRTNVATVSSTARDGAPAGALARQRRAFADAVSHELRTPTASVLGFAELLLIPDLDAGQRQRYTEVLYEEAARLARLVEWLDRGDLNIPPLAADDQRPA